jgi:hypothetical protein
MRHFLSSLCILLISFTTAQTIAFGEKYRGTMIATIPLNDSLKVYQCHVEEATQTTVTDKGQTLQGKKQNYSITEKYIITRTNDGFQLKYYTSSLTTFPNRKFSGLKKKERPYWEFKLEKILQLNEHDVLVFAAAELLGKEANEYDFAITKYTTNQVILNGKRAFKQLVLDTKTTIRQSLEGLK